jgi:hypothetical protein
MSLLFNGSSVTCKDLLTLWLRFEFLIRLDTAVCSKIYRKALWNIYHLSQFILTEVTTNVKWVILRSIKVSVVCLSKSEVVQFCELIEKEVQKLFLFDDYSITTYDTSNYRNILASFMVENESLKDLTVTDVFEFDNLFISSCAEKFASLTHLKLVWTRNYHFDNELVVAGRHFCEGGRCCLLASVCKNLMSLNLWSSDTSLSESFLESVATNNSQLTSLSVRVDGAHLSDATVACIVIHCCHLIELRLTKCFVSNKSFALVLSCCKHLRRFAYRVDENSQGAAGFQYTSGDTISSFDQFRVGKDVQIRHSPALFAARECDEVVASASNVDSVVLFAFSEVGFSDSFARIVESVVNTSPNLLSFQTVDCDCGYDVSVIVRLLSVCTSLSMLSLSAQWGCAEFGEVSSLPHPALTSLSVGGCSELTEEAVVAFLVVHPQLQTLNIQLDPNVENALLVSSLRRVVEQRGFGVALHERMFGALIECGVTM